jgi:hypothetical protein
VARHRCTVPPGGGKALGRREAGVHLFGDQVGAGCAGACVARPRCTVPPGGGKALGLREAGVHLFGDQVGAGRGGAGRGLGGLRPACAGALHRAGALRVGSGRRGR